LNKADRKPKILKRLKNDAFEPLVRKIVATHVNRVILSAEKPNITRIGISPKSVFPDKIKMSAESNVAAHKEKI
jgi:hypothetical protein